MVNLLIPQILKNNMTEQAKNLFDHRVQNEELENALKSSIEGLFPIENSGKKLVLRNITVEDNLNDYDFPEQKEAKVKRKSWQMPIFADFEIQNESGRVISKQSKLKIGNLPKITNRFTTIIEGNEYQTVNQFRRKSGVYSRIKRNGELEAEFNLAKGKNFKMQLDPISQLFIISFANRKYRLWTLLNTLGMTDSEMEKMWGSKLLDINKKGALNTEVSEINSIYEIVNGSAPKNFDEARKGLVDYFNNRTELDPEVTKMTLGKKFSSVNSNTLLHTSEKLLNINKGVALPDDRDSLLYKRIYAVDDLVKSYFEKQAPIIQNKIKRSLLLKEKVREIVSPATFGDPIKKFFTVGDLSSTPAQTNPVEIANVWRKTTPMGTGGIKSHHAITMETRDVQPTHLGFLDPLNTPESGKVGVTVGLSSEVRKRGNDIVTPVVDKNNVLHWLDPIQFYNSKIGFPDQYSVIDGKLVPREDKVRGINKGKNIDVSPDELDYYLRSPRTMFSYPSNLVPFLPNTQANRASTGARMIGQAMALDDREPPLVRTYRDKTTTYEDMMGGYLNPSLSSGESGVVDSITDKYMKIKLNNGKEKVLGLYDNFPLNQDGYLHSTVLVKPGDKVDNKSVLTESNYSRKHALALGKNLTVAYMPYKGYNFEDGAVITEDASKKLSHTMLHRVNVFYTPRLSIFEKDKFNAWFPNVLTSDNSKKLDERGIVKVGQTINPGEVLAAFLIEKELDDREMALKKLDKFIFHNYGKNVSTWEEEETGIVTDVSMTGRNIDIYIKSTHPFKEGDKLSGRYGNKYIVTKIIPTSDAPFRPNGEPIDIMLSPHSVPSRMNIGQILETAAGKIADKTGKPYIVNNFENPGNDMANKIFTEMKDLGIEPNELLTDGKTGQTIKNPIFVGKQYIMKLRHIINKKVGVHNYGSYDVDEQPAGKGAQKVGNMETYAYLAHGAKSNLYEISNIKGRKNEEYWRDLQFGLPPGKPSRNFIFEKMITYLKGAGINVNKKGNKLQILPLTDDDIQKMSNGEILDPGAMLKGKNLTSRKNGLFDNEITGGARGEQWSHINLAQRLPNPMFEDAIMKALNLTENAYDNILNGNVELNGKTGPGAVVEALRNLNISERLNNLKLELKTAPPTNVNKLNTKIRYMEALQDLKMDPIKAYTISKMPIIPPVFRPVYPLPSGDMVVSDINKHYHDVGLINIKLKNSDEYLPDKVKLEGEKKLYDSIKAMQGFIDPVTYSTEKYKGFLLELGKMKSGLIHGKAWSHRQDISGRSTITVEPSLGLDEVGLPTDFAYTQLKPFILKSLKESGIKATQALKDYEDRTPMAFNALEQVLKDRPVILNRAPALHKHSVQAFKPILTTGKSIRLNPLVVKGFNADFDGDTMSVMVPIGKEAVEEARQMMPSKILFKHGDNSLMPAISQDYLFGLHELSKITIPTVKQKFNNISQAKNSKIPWTEVFLLDGKEMTVGQYMINSSLPTSLKDYTREMNKKVVGKLLEELGKNHPTFVEDVFNSWKDLGAAYSYINGNTISITDFATDKSYRNKILKSEMPKINKLTGNERISAINTMTRNVQLEQDKAEGKTNNIYKMLNAGSFTKPDSVRQILSMPGVMTDIENKPLPNPVIKSYGEGLDTSSYFNTMYSARKGTVDRSVNTQQTGALTKDLLNVARRFLVVESDCGTKEGMEFDINEKNLMDRTLLNTIPGVGKRGDIINSELLMKAKSKNLQTIWARSPLTCDSIEGVCQLCYGLLPNGQLPSIGTNVGILDSEAITERATQLTMQTFHTGGSALGGGGIQAGFPRLEQLLKVPERLSGKATLSENDGVIKSITKNQTGGYSIKVNDKNHVIPAGRRPIIDIGQNVKAGDPLSDGVIKPQELGALKTHLDAQRYIVNEASNIYGGDFYKKTFETVVKSISDNADIIKAPDDSGFLRGDASSISYLNYLNKRRKKEGLEEIEFKPYFKSIQTSNTDDEDWMTKVTTNRVKAALTTGAAKGLYANLKGKDPIPAYLYGEEFGKGLDYERGIFY